MTEIRIVPGKERCVFTTKAFAKDEIIFKELPLVSAQFSWNKACKYLACDYCLFPLETAEENVRRMTKNNSISLPYLEADLVAKKKSNFVECNQCHVKYCSQECKLAADNKYHKILCLGKDVENLEHPINEINECWKQMHFPPETCTIQLVLRIFAMIKQSQNPKEMAQKFLNFCGCPVNSDGQIYHKILGEEFVFQLAQLRALMLKIFPEEDVDLKTFLTVEGFQNLFAMIGMNSQGIGASSFSAWIKNVEKLPIEDEKKEEFDEMIEDIYVNLEETIGTQFLNIEGTALFENQSKVNHSCRPNAEIQYNHSNHQLELVTLSQTLGPNEEICISYLDSCQLERSRHSRQKHLMENYVFLCKCELCTEQANDPDETSDEEMSEEENDVDEMETLTLN